MRLKVRRSRPARPCAARKPRDYQPQRPGDLVHEDTLELRPRPGVLVQQFIAAFEQACRHRRLKLFVLPPRSPQLNERAQRTHTEEF